MTELVDIKKLVLRVWLSLWLVLIVLAIAKLVFNEWFPIVINNEIFININNYVENNHILKKCIMFVFYLLNINIWYLTASSKKKYTNLLEFVLIQVSIVALFHIKQQNNLIGSMLELIILIIIPLINLFRSKKYSKTKSFILPFFIYILINIWQLNIMFIRGINDIISSLPFLIGIILQLDYYIFNIITWLGVSYMGLWGGGFLWGKSITELQALKDKELKKQKPDAKLLADIDKRIEKLNK